MRTVPLPRRGLLILCLLGATAGSARGQACPPAFSGDRVRVDIESNFLNRLWYTRNPLRALFTRTVPVEGRYESATADTLVLERYTALVEGRPFGLTESAAFDRREVRHVRKICSADPSWDGAVWGAVAGAEIMLAYDVALAPLLLGLGTEWALLTHSGANELQGQLVFLPILRHNPLAYVVAASAGLVAGGVVDWVTPGWVDVGVVPGPPGRPGMSVGVRLPLR